VMFVGRGCRGCLLPFFGVWLQGVLLTRRLPEQGVASMANVGIALETRWKKDGFLGDFAAFVCHLGAFAG